jgi:hypothetical protein
MLDPGPYQINIDPKHCYLWYHGLYISTNDACFCFTTILHHAQPGAAIADLLFVQDLDAYESVSVVYIVRTQFVKELNQSSFDLRFS